MSTESIYKELIIKRLGSSKVSFLKAPGRINLIGEHTDYNQGLCLPATFQKAIYFGIIPSVEPEFISLKYNETWFPKSQPNHPEWAVYFKGVWNLLREKGFSWPDFKLVFDGDLPSGAGLSSSSAISCGFICIINEFGSLGLSLEKLTAHAVLAEKASGVEGGMMDQISIFNGIKNHALLIQCSDWNFKNIPIPSGPVCWLIVDTKVKHQLIHSDYNNRSRVCRLLLEHVNKSFPEIQSLSELSWEQIMQLKSRITCQQLNFLIYINEENQRVLDMVDALGHSDFEKTGNILQQGHEGLRKLYQVSCEELDFLVKYATQSQKAFGARMMGGGFGGASIHLVSEDYKLEYTKGIKNAFANRFGYPPDIFEANFEDGIRFI